jgi:hypothetical protein
MSGADLIPKADHDPRAVALVEDLSFRYPWEAGLAFGVSAGLLAAIALFAPQWWIASQVGPSLVDDSSYSETATAYAAFVFMVAMGTGIAAGLAAFAAWRLLLVPRLDFTFVPAAAVGSVVALMVTVAFVFTLEGPVQHWWGTRDPRQATGAISLLFVGLALSLPTAIVGGLVGGVVGSAQGHGLRAAVARLAVAGGGER